MRLRTFAALLASFSLVPSPASAVPLYWVFTGNAHIDCFGCGVPSWCDANLNIVGGTHNGTAATTACVAMEPTGALCLLTGEATGTVVGTSGTATGLRLDFYWTRVGVHAVITVSGDAMGHGEALFIAPGTACGAALEAQIVGWVGGI